MLNLCVGIRLFPSAQVGRRLLISLTLALLILLTACQNGYKVLSETTAKPADTNAYLLYDVRSSEAALFDVGGPIDSLTAVIEQEGLRLKYIFSTHGHPDHVAGLPDIRHRYLKARWGISREDYEDMAIYAAWEEVLPPEEVAGIKAAAEQDPAIAELFAFDYKRLGEPDIFLGDGQIYRLGSLEIRVFLMPGHSRGSICFHSGHALFSGDVLYRGRVGSTDHPKSGGFEAITSSVRRLYKILPEETIVYPGHGDFTDIGTEMKENADVRADPGRNP